MISLTLMIALLGLAVGWLITWRLRRLDRFLGRPGGSLIYRAAYLAVASGVVSIVIGAGSAIARRPASSPDFALNAWIIGGMLLAFGGAFVAGLTRPSKNQIARYRRKQRRRHISTGSPNVR